MNATCLQRGSATTPLPLGEGPRPDLPLPLGEGRGEGAFRRPAFSLVELLVVVSIMLVLMAMVGGGVAAARGSQKRQATQSLIAKLDAVVQQQFATYSSRSVPASVLSGSATGKSAARAAYLGRLASAEMPDNWEHVELIASGSAGLPLTAPQRTYQAIWNNLPASRKEPASADYVGRQFADAECLFMIVMQGGVADCLDCAALRSADIGDRDTDAAGNVVGDGMPEFLDAWGNPIRYVLWPAGLELPPGSGRFFSTTAPFTPGTPQSAKGGTMRPLIYSTGAADAAQKTIPKDGTGLPRDAITNFDTEAKK